MLTGDVIVFFILLVLGAWLGHQAMGIDAALSGVRARIRSIKNTENRIKARLEKLDDEEKRVKEENEGLVKAVEEAKQERAIAEKALAEVEASRRQRLFVLSQRRVAGDTDWVVRLVNDQAAAAASPISDEWHHGREYLVWAKTQEDAMKLAVRRFTGRGSGIRAVSAEPGNLFGKT